MTTTSIYHLDYIEEAFNELDAYATELAKQYSELMPWSNAVDTTISELALPLTPIGDGYYRITNKDDQVSIFYKDTTGVIFNVVSSSREWVYNTTYDTVNGWFCTCEDYQYRKKYCKHMKKCKEYYQKAYGVELPETVWNSEDDSTVII